MNASEYASKISDLSQDNKIYFYESLAHRLTVGVREIWSSETRTLEQQNNQMKWMNEIQHRVTSKIRTERLQTHEWSEQDFINLISEHVNNCPEIIPIVSWAITSSYEDVQ